jgi:hypothetical protein
MYRVEWGEGRGAGCSSRCYVRADVGFYPRPKVLDEEKLRLAREGSSLYSVHWATWDPNEDSMG